MGDTGSLALGALLAGVAILSGEMLLLLLVGGVFVAETLSVIVQVAYFKLTNGKRILRMSPLHHHFELSGWPETKVTARFWLASLACSLARPGDRAMSDMFAFGPHERGARHRTRTQRPCERRRAARTRRRSLCDRRKISGGTRADAIAAVERAGARFVAPDGVAALAAGLTSAILSPGVPPTSPVGAGDQRGQRSGDRRDRTRVPPLPRADRRRHRNEGQVDDDRAHRPLAARMRFHACASAATSATR